MLPRGASPLRRVVPGAVTQQMYEWLRQTAPVGCQVGTHKDQASTMVPSFVPYHRAPREGAAEGDTQGGQAS